MVDCLGSRASSSTILFGYLFFSFSNFLRQLRMMVAAVGVGSFQHLIKWHFIMVFLSLAAEWTEQAHAPAQANSYSWGVRGSLPPSQFLHPPPPLPAATSHRMPAMPQPPEFLPGGTWLARPQNVPFNQNCVSRWVYPVWVARLQLRAST